jgi:predicted porin
MRKWTLAFAALAFSGAAWSQSSVTLYGTIDSAITYARPGNGQGNEIRADSGVSNGSRWGVTGKEDLGGGLAARFVLESGFASNSGALQQGGLFFGRQAAVGLVSSSGWSVMAGRQNSPISLSLIATDAGGQIFWGNNQVAGNGVYQSPAATASSAGYQATNRVDNSVLGTYTIKNLTLRLMVSTGDNTNSGSGRMINGSATYATDRVLITASITRFRQYQADIPAGADPAWQTEYMVGGTYDFQIVKVLAGYYRYNPSEINLAQTATTLVDTSTYWLGVRIPLFTADRLIAEVLRTRFDFPTSRGYGTTFGIAYDHPLSKRTSVYASYGQLNNSSNSPALLWAGTAVLNFPATRGACPKAFSVGIRHVF